MVNGEATAQERDALIVFPSTLMLEEYVKNELLPERIASAVEWGDMEFQSELTPGQRCLTAGFTTAQCLKLGNKKPDVDQHIRSKDQSRLNIPRYDADLKLLD